MKKILSIVFTLLIVSSSFAQSAKYKELFEKAQKYEQEKKWVYALGAYYDAMELRPNLAEPFYAYKKLAEAIEAGNPGYGEFDDFSLYDGWIEIMQEYEKYWTENLPKAIVFQNLEKSDMDMENRKITYSVSVNAVPTEKYLTLKECFSKGKEKAYKTSWSSYLKNWPDVSVYNSDKDKLLSEKNGIPFIKASENWRMGYDNILDENINYPAFTTNFYMAEKDWNGYSFNPNGATITSLYEVKFQIIDKSDKKLFQTDIAAVAYDQYMNEKPVKFTVSLDVAKIIESKEIKFVLTSASLRYGVLKEFPKSDNNKWKENLKILNIPVSEIQSALLEEKHQSFGKCSSDPKILVGNIYQYNTILFEEHDKIKKQLDYSEREWGNGRIVFAEIDGKKDFPKLQIYRISLRDFEPNWKNSPYSYSYFEDLVGKNEAKRKLIYRMGVCNQLSKNYGFTPCYKIRGQASDLINEYIAFMEHSDDIECDINADGYRFSSEIEKEYLLELKKEKTKERVFFAAAHEEERQKWIDFYPEAALVRTLSK